MNATRPAPSASWDSILASYKLPSGIACAVYMDRKEYSNGKKEYRDAASGDTEEWTSLPHGAVPYVRRPDLA